MPGFELLDVAIGMSFLYLLLSLICSAANELISAMLHARAKFLERGIVTLLGSEELKNSLYSHPLIRNLYGEARGVFGKWNLPPYIPATNFALAVMDMIEPNRGTQDALVPAARKSAARAAEAAAPPPTGAGLFEALRQNLQNAPAAVAIPHDLQRALICLVEAAGKDAARTRQNIEDWYNSTMDRVSGAYKRRTQFAIFGIGLIVTIAVNADSIAVAKRLSTSKTLAAAVADSAEQFVKSNTAIQAGGTVSAQTAIHQLDSRLATLDSLSLPVGWSGPGSDNLLPARGNFLPGWGDLFKLHWPGWLLTALAVSLGAPFWFDLLNRFMVVRSTVKPKEKSQEEESKD